jgi:hypothetical protein
MAQGPGKAHCNAPEGLSTYPTLPYTYIRSMWAYRCWYARMPGAACPGCCGSGGGIDAGFRSLLLINVCSLLVPRQAATCVTTVLVKFTLFYLLHTTNDTNDEGHPGTTKASTLWFCPNLTTNQLCSAIQLLLLTTLPKHKRFAGTSAKC